MTEGITVCTGHRARVTNLNYDINLWNLLSIGYGGASNWIIMCAVKCIPCNFDKENENHPVILSDPIVLRLPLNLAF